MWREDAAQEGLPMPVDGQLRLPATRGPSPGLKSPEGLERFVEAAIKDGFRTQRSGEL